MMCQRIGFPPISIIGFGMRCVSSPMRTPSPPQKITTFTLLRLSGSNEPPTIDHSE